MKRRDLFALAGGGAIGAMLGHTSSSVAEIAKTEAKIAVRKRVKTADGVELSVLDIGDERKPALLFIHGLSQSALSWTGQLTDAGLISKYRLVALDLRGHGQSQGALGALDAAGRALPTLSSEKYVVVEDDSKTSRLWANDLDAVITQLKLVSPTFVGWSYGAVVALDYLRANNGLGAADRVILTGGTPVLLAPGTKGGGGAEAVFGPGVAPAVFKTLDDNLLTGAPSSGHKSTISDIVGGMTEFVGLAYADSVPARPAPAREEVLAGASFNILLPPAARQAIVLRQFDFRPFVTKMNASAKSRIKVLTAMADQVIQSANTGIYFDQLGLSQVRLENEGHAFFARNPDLFKQELLRATT